MKYTVEEKKKAVELYIQYGCSASAVIRELGYPNRLTLRLWYRDFKETGVIRKR